MPRFNEIFIEIIPEKVQNREIAVRSLSLQNFLIKTLSLSIFYCRFLFVFKILKLNNKKTQVN